MLPAPGTNQIAGFSGYRPLTIKEINEKSYWQTTLMGLQKKQLIPNNQGFKVKIKMKYMK